MRAAGVLALFGALATTVRAVVVGTAAGQDAEGDPLLQLVVVFGGLLLVMALGQVWGLIQVLRGRSWLLPVLTAAPALWLFEPLPLFGAPDVRDLAFCVTPGCSLVAAGLAPTPTTRQWVAARRAARAGGPRPAGPGS